MRTTTDAGARVPGWTRVCARLALLLLLTAMLLLAPSPAHLLAAGSAAPPPHGETNVEPGGAGAAHSGGDGAARSAGEGRVQSAGDRSARSDGAGRARSGGAGTAGAGGEGTARTGGPGTAGSGGDGTARFGGGGTSDPGGGPAMQSALEPSEEPAGVPAVGRSWPVGGRPRVLRGWEPPATVYGRGHRGVDLAAAAGTPVRAVAAGRVSFAGRVAGKGAVSVELPGTGEPPLRTTYEPVRASVAQGDVVAAGAVGGTAEPTGSDCTAPCLHWGLLRGDTYLDPRALLPPRPLHRGPRRLLPVLGAPAPEGAGGAGVGSRRAPGERAEVLPGTLSGSGAGAPPGTSGGSGESGGSGVDAPQGHGDRRLRDRRRVLRGAQFDAADRGVDDTLEQHRGQPGLAVAQPLQRLDDHGDQAAVRGADLLPGTRVQLAGGDGHHGPVPPVAHQLQLLAYVRLHLGVGPLGRRHRRLDLGRPDREVDLAQLLDHGRPGPEVLVHGGAREARALGEGGEGQRLRTAFGQQGAGRVQQGGSLHRPVLGHGGRSNPWHAVHCTDAPSGTGVVRPEPQVGRPGADAVR